MDGSEAAVVEDDIPSPAATVSVNSSFNFVYNNYASVFSSLSSPITRLLFTLRASFMLIQFLWLTIAIGFGSSSYSSDSPSDSSFISVNSFYTGIFSYWLLFACIVILFFPLYFSPSQKDMEIPEFIEREQLKKRIYHFFDFIFMIPAGLLLILLLRYPSEENTHPAIYYCTALVWISLYIVYISFPVLMGLLILLFLPCLYLLARYLHRRDGTASPEGGPGSSGLREEVISALPTFLFANILSKSSSSSSSSLSSISSPSTKGKKVRKGGKVRDGLSKQGDESTQRDEEEDGDDDDNEEEEEEEGEIDEQETGDDARSFSSSPNVDPGMEMQEQKRKGSKKENPLQQSIIPTAASTNQSVETNGVVYIPSSTISSSTFKNSTSIIASKSFSPPKQTTSTDTILSIDDEGSPAATSSTTRNGIGRSGSGGRLFSLSRKREDKKKKALEKDDSPQLPIPVLQITSEYASCSICLCDYQPDDVLKVIPACNHHFHAECLKEWLLRKADCPSCRIKISSD